MDNAVVVFTAKGIDQILSDGGSSSWRLDRNHARQCEFVVCTRNANGTWVEGPEPHHSAFLVGRLKDVVPAARKATLGKWLITFSEYALVDVPDVWKGDRNPVKYGRLEDLGIDPSTLTWQPMPAASDGAPEDTHASAPHAIRPLSIPEAKEGLGLKFGVPPDAIEITIRG